MSDHLAPSDRDDELLRHALATLDRAATPQIRPPGSAAARVRARRRRQHRLATGALAALIAIPLVLDVTGIPPRFSAPAGPVASGPSGMRQAAPGPGILENAAATIDWTWVAGADTCASGTVELRTDVPSSGNATVRSWVIEDIDRDGGFDDVVALVDCHRPDGAVPGPQMIALFSQERPFTLESPGSFRMVGSIVRAGPDLADKNIVDFWLIGRDQVLVQIEDAPGCCEPPPTVVTTQWRQYALTEPGYPQVPAPAPFGGDGATLELQIDYPAPIAFGPPDGAGVRTGELVVTVINRSSQPAGLGLDVNVFGGVAPPPDDAACKRAICTFDLGRIPGGGSATRTVTMTATAATDLTANPTVAIVSVRSINDLGTFRHGYFWIEGIAR